MPYFLNPALSANPTGEADVTKSGGGGGNPKGGGGGSEDTTTVYDMRLSEMENVLSKDGYLSPADNLQLAQAARGFANNLNTPSKRATLINKALKYEADANDAGLKQTDISSFDKYSEDDARKTAMEKYNDVQGYLDNMVKSYMVKVDALDQRMQNLDPADTTSFVNYSQAYNEASQKLQDWQSANSAYKKGDKQALGVYAQTDPETGDIVQIEYAPVGRNTSVKDAKLTNLKVDGIPLYVVPNRNDNGVEGAKFLNVDVQTVDPNRVDTKNGAGQPILANTLQTKDYYGTDFKLSDLRQRMYVPKGSYALGMDGKTLYQNVDGNTYKKFTGFTPEILGVDRNSILKIPAAWERRLTPMITQNIDANSLPQPLVGPIPTRTNVPMTKVPIGKPPVAPAAAGTPQNTPQVPPTSVSMGKPPAFKQPQGAELQQKNTQNIVNRNPFQSFIDFGKRFIGR